MPPTLINDVLITNEVYDRLLVQVTNPVLHQLTLKYSISNIDSHSIIRKGSFQGFGVQLLMTHIPEGSYIFCIAAEGSEPYNFPFEKKSESFVPMLMSK